MSFDRPVVSVGGGPLLAPVPRALADFTSSDPSAVVSAVTQPNGTGGFFNATMANPAVVSGVPNTGRSWSVSARGLTGAVRDSDMFDLLCAAIVWAGDNDPSTADVRIMAGFADNVIASATFGLGAALTASGSDWAVGHLVFPLAGAWTHVAGGAANANTRGARMQARHVNNATQRNVGACALDGSALEIATGAASLPASSAVGDNLTHFFVAVGWATGVGGTNGAVVKLSGQEILLRMADLAGITRPLG